MYIHKYIYSHRQWTSPLHPSWHCLGGHSHYCGWLISGKGWQHTQTASAPTAGHCPLLGCSGTCIHIERMFELTASALSSNGSNHVLYACMGNSAVSVLVHVQITIYVSTIWCYNMWLPETHRGWVSSSLWRVRPHKTKLRSIPNFNRWYRPGGTISAEQHTYIWRDSSEFTPLLVHIMQPATHVLYTYCTICKELTCKAVCHGRWKGPCRVAASWQWNKPLKHINKCMSGTSTVLVQY